MAVTPLLALPPPTDSGFEDAIEARLQAEVVFSQELNVLQLDVNAKQATATAASLAAQADRALCASAQAAVAAQSPVTNAAAAAASAAAAAVYAAQAQATNPDSPIRLNPRRITANFTVPSDSNAASVGPITIADGVTVTVADGATWSVH
jgi:hypothetical protein